MLALVGYVKTSITTTIDGVGELWANHGRCNDIRKKLSTHRDLVKGEWAAQGDLTNLQKEQLKKIQGGISYEEYVFLQKGKEDRGKVLNLLFLMWGAPKFLPYALLFNPSILPTPFKTTTEGEESIWALQSRQRSAAVLKALVALEQSSKETSGSGFSLAKMNVFGKKEQAKKQLQLVTMTETCRRMLQDSTISGRLGAEQVLSSLPRGWLYKTATPDVNGAGDDENNDDDVIPDFDRGEKRLVHVPKPIIQGLTSVLNGGAGGLFANFQPTFMTRGRLLGHITKVEQADDFLVGAQIDLDSIPHKLLREACGDRFIDNPVSSEEEMRLQLANWLDLTVHEPAAKLQNKEALYHNGNMARMVLMAYNCMESTRAPSSASTIPRLLYTGTSKDDSDKLGNGFLKR